MALGLGVNETLKNCECPKCKGGRSGENSFSVTRDSQGLLYNCFRASCMFHGYIMSMANTQNVITARSRVSEYNYDIALLSTEQTQFFIDKFGLYEQEIQNNNFRFNPYRESFVYPMYDRLGYQIGVVDRAYNGRNPKAITYYFDDTSPSLHFPVGEKKGDAIVIVEDTISAIKSARYIDSCAVLSANLTDFNAQFLQENYNKLIILLDGDAFSQAIKLKKQYELFFDEVIVKYLPQDIKNMNNNEVEAFFSGERLIKYNKNK